MDDSFYYNKNVLAWVIQMQQRKEIRESHALKKLYGNRLSSEQQKQLQAVILAEYFSDQLLKRPYFQLEHTTEQPDIYYLKNNAHDPEDAVEGKENIERNRFKKRRKTCSWLSECI